MFLQKMLKFKKISGALFWQVNRYSLASQCPSCEKYLEYFSKFGFLIFLATQFGDLFAGGRSSRRGLKDFRGLPRDSFAGRTSSREKHL